MPNVINFGKPGKILTPLDNGKVLVNGELTTQTSQTITQNGTYDTTTKNETVVNVPNSYGQADEGKVVSNGALVSQTSQTFTQNGTYDTTLISEITANIAGDKAVEAEYQGFSYCFVDGSAEELRSYNAKTNYISFFELKANHTYALFVGAVAGNRRRVSFFGNKDYTNDFEYYVNNSTGANTAIYSGGTCLAPLNPPSDDTGDALLARIIYTPLNDGTLVYSSDSTGNVLAKTYCVDITDT